MADRCKKLAFRAIGALGRGLEISLFREPLIQFFGALGNDTLELTLTPDQQGD